MDNPSLRHYRAPQYKVFRVLDKVDQLRPYAQSIRILYQCKAGNSRYHTKNQEHKMTYWKVDFLNSAESVPKTHWFRNSHDAEQFCDRIPYSPYATSYYCREVRIPNQILDAARREALKRAEAIESSPVPEEADPLHALRIAC